MPFGDYADFAACVAANHDKGDPKAYCAALMHRIEGTASLAKSAEGTTLDAAWQWLDPLLKAGHQVVAEPRWRGVRAVATHGEAVLDVVQLARPDGDAPTVVLDCLALGEQDVREEPYAARRVRALKAVLRDGTMQMTAQWPVSGVPTLQRAYRNAEHPQSSGLVLKTRAGRYGESWYAVRFPRVTPAHVGVRVLKATVEDQKVYGVVFEPETEDTQGDVVEAGEIERAAHQFMADYRKGETQLFLDHETPLDDHDAVLVENYVAPHALTIGGQPVKQGAWVQVWHVKAAGLWELVRNGTLTGFSFGGTGLRRPVTKAAREPLYKVERGEDQLITAIRTPQGLLHVERDPQTRALTGFSPA